MVDVHTPAQRSFNMSRVRSKNTGPEMLLRRALHSSGLRYRIHGIDLPGRPDIIFTKHRAVVFVHGCFWHGHNCPLFKLPATRSEFWETKIIGTRARDARDAAALAVAGWRVLTVWECALRGSKRLPMEALLSQAISWLQGNDAELTLTGNWF